MQYYGTTGSYSTPQNELLANSHILQTAYLTER